MDIRNEVRQAETRIWPYIRQTILEYSSSLSQRSGADVYCKLEEAGYVEVLKEFVDKKPHTMLNLTQPGRDAFTDYRRQMQQVFKDLPE